MMDTRKIRSLWPEDLGFHLERQDTGSEYIYIQYLTAVEIWVKGEIVRAEPGAVILYNRHSYQYFKATYEPLVHDWLHIEGNVDEMARKCGIGYNTLYYAKNSGKITAIIQELELENLHRDRYSADIMDCGLKELLLVTAREIHRKAQPNISAATEEAFIRARAKIHGEYGKNWSVKEMADFVHLSPSRFYSLYHDVFGISPMQDLTNARMEHAKYLLLQKKYTVREVAKLVGYGDEFYFTRKFKQFTGETPGKYK